MLRLYIARVGLWAGAATAAAVAGLFDPQAAGAHVYAASPQWWAVTDPVPPPPFAPELWNRFLFLYSGYSSLPSPKPISFAAWIARHGVVDPGEQHAMLILYRWFEAFG